MREEFVKLLDGDFVNDGVFRPMILRALDDDNPCVCKSAIRGGRAITNCPYCQDEGYHWTEYAVKVYGTYGPFLPRRGDAGKADFETPVFLDESGSVVFWFKWNLLPPGANDSLFVLRLNSDGSVYYFTDSQGNKHPERLERYLIASCARFYADRSELAFMRVVAKHDSTWMADSACHKRY